MNELIPYLMQRIRQHNGTDVAKPGTALERLILHGEVQPPVQETAGKPAAPMGPLIEGEAIRPPATPATAGAMRPPATAGGLGSFGGGMAHPLMAAIMGSIQGDVLNNHRTRLTPGQAYPAGQVTSAPMPPMQPSPNDQVAARFGGMQPPAPPSPNDQVAARFGGMQPPAQPSPNDQVAARFGAMQPPAGGPTPMPQPRPQMAQPTPMPQPRPPQAPQAPQEMGFFQRNTAMMRDPVTGMFIDPSAAARAQAQGGGLMDKMMGLLHNKANNA